MFLRDKEPFNILFFSSQCCL